ncbi:DUF4288 domain-containing protein [Actinomycetospora sp. C-140]
MTATEPWVAILVFRATSDAPDFQAVYREDVAVFPAASEAEARAAALTHARSRETSVVNPLGETVVTTLVRLVDVAPVPGGGELYRRHFRDLEAYRRFEPLMASTSW